MAQNLKKCLDIASGNRPSTGGPAGTTLDLINNSNTTWVRVWAKWAECWPEPGTLNLSNLAADLQQLKAAGKRIILVSWTTPMWANGMDDSYELDRPNWDLVKYDRVSQSEPRIVLKSLVDRIPTSVAVGSPWSDWIGILIQYFRGYIDALEVCNEPNFQMWPLYAPNPIDGWQPGAVTIQNTIAAMFRTALWQRGRYSDGRNPLLLGPAQSDNIKPPSEGAERLRVDFLTFQSKLLDALAGAAVGDRFCWSHHNYTDIEKDYTGADHRAGQCRRGLIGRWPGYPYADASRPWIWCTEGGGRWQKLAKEFDPEKDVTLASNDQAFEDMQSARISRAHTRLNTDAANGEGIGMMTNYQLYTSGYLLLSKVDSGLLYPQCASGVARGEPRLAYYTWAGLPPGT